jgi:hypothetical protein
MGTKGRVLAAWPTAAAIVVVGGMAAANIPDSDGVITSY